MKTCSKCKIQKEKTEFWPRSDAPHRLVSQCKTCSLKRVREYHQQNPEAKKRANKKWIAENPEKELARHKKYREENREACRERGRKWREQNEDTCLGRAQKWRGENRAKARRAVKKWAALNSSKIENKRLIRLYGITIKEWDKLFSEQSGACAICRTFGKDLKKKLVVDHNHATGQIRGLLCGSCNSALGMFKDSTSIVEAALLYLRR